MDTQVREDRCPTRRLQEERDDKKCQNNNSQQAGESRADHLKQAAQQLIEGINMKRQQDTDLVSELHRTMEEDMNEACLIVQQGLSEVYDDSSSAIQGKLEELFATLDRIEKLELELKQVSNALGVLYADVRG